MSLPNCGECGIQLKDYRSIMCRSCSKKGKLNPMMGRVGAKHHSWKNGYINKSIGYRIVQVDGRKVYEHRYIVEQKLGRKLTDREIVHHINHDKTDNRPENLAIMTQAEHINIHKPMLGKKSKVKRDPITQRFTNGT